MKYTIINKFNGKLHRNACGIYDNTETPINEDILQYVPLTEELINLVTNTVPNTVLDEVNTTYNVDTNTWNIATRTLEVVDVVANRTKELNRLKLEAQKFSQIEDIPPSLRTKVVEYIAELNAFVIPTDTSTRPEGSMSLISWPTKPWV
jgi:hypothetical protein